MQWSFKIKMGGRSINFQAPCRVKKNCKEMHATIVPGILTILLLVYPVPVQGRSDAAQAICWGEWELPFAITIGPNYDNLYFVVVCLVTS
jgi:hypothetical protein